MKHVTRCDSCTKPYQFLHENLNLFGVFLSIILQYTRKLRKTQISFRDLYRQLNSHKVGDEARFVYPEKNKVGFYGKNIVGGKKREKKVEDQPTARVELAAFRSPFSSTRKSLTLYPIELGGHMLMLDSVPIQYTTPR